MSPVRPDIRIIAVLSAIAFLVLFCIWLRISGAEWGLILKAASKSGVIMTLLGLFWAFYIRFGWRMRPLRLWGWLSLAPDLQGRWEGTVCRHKDDTPHPFVVEISQTFHSISYRTFSRNSNGESLTASIFADETGTVFKVISTWRVTTRRIGDNTVEDTFYGTSSWNVSIDREKKVINDTYFTGREPQTKGSVNVTWKTRELKNCFE